jgi:hypothetical protein
VTPPVSTPVTKPRSAGGGKRKSRESLSDELNAIEKANLRERSDEYAQ